MTPLVTDKPIEKILKRAFPSDRHPVAVVNIKTPSDSVDVNLEPNKQSVLIKRKRELELTIENAISNHYDKEDNNLQLVNPRILDGNETTSDFQTKQNCFDEIDRNSEKSNEFEKRSTEPIFFERDSVEATTLHSMIHSSGDNGFINIAAGRCNDLISNDNRDDAAIEDVTKMRLLSSHNIFANEMRIKRLV